MGDLAERSPSRPHSTTRRGLRFQAKVIVQPPLIEEAQGSGNGKHRQATSFRPLDKERIMSVGRQYQNRRDTKYDAAPMFGTSFSQLLKYRHRTRVLNRYHKKLKMAPNFWHNIAERYVAAAILVLEDEMNGRKLCKLDSTNAREILRIALERESLVERAIGLLNPWLEQGGDKRIDVDRLMSYLHGAGEGCQAQDALPKIVISKCRKLTYWINRFRRDPLSSNIEFETLVVAAILHMLRTTGVPIDHLDAVYGLLASVRGMHPGVDDRAEKWLEKWNRYIKKTNRQSPLSRQSGAEKPAKTQAAETPQLAPDATPTAPRQVTDESVTTVADVKREFEEEMTQFQHSPTPQTEDVVHRQPQRRQLGVASQKDTDPIIAVADELMHRGSDVEFHWQQFPQQKLDSTQAVRLCAAILIVDCMGFYIGGREVRFSEEDKRNARQYLERQERAAVIAARLKLANLPGVRLPAQEFSSVVRMFNITPADLKSVPDRIEQQEQHNEGGQSSGEIQRFNTPYKQFAGLQHGAGRIGAYLEQLRNKPGFVHNPAERYVAAALLVLKDEEIGITVRNIDVASSREILKLAWQVDGLVDRAIKLLDPWLEQHGGSEGLAGSNVQTYLMEAKDKEGHQPSDLDKSIKLGADRQAVPASRRPTDVLEEQPIQVVDVPPRRIREQVSSLRRFIQHSSVFGRLYASLDNDPTLTRDADLWCVAAALRALDQGTDATWQVGAAANNLLKEAKKIDPSLEDRARAALKARTDPAEIAKQQLLRGGFRNEKMAAVAAAIMVEANAVVKNGKPVEVSEEDREAAQESLEEVPHQVQKRAFSMMCETLFDCDEETVTAATAIMIGQDAVLKDGKPVKSTKEEKQAAQRFLKSVSPYVRRSALRLIGKAQEITEEKSGRSAEADKKKTRASVPREEPKKEEPTEEITRKRIKPAIVVQDSLEFVQTCDRETFDRCITTCQWNTMPKEVREAIEQRRDGFILEAIRGSENVPTRRNLSKNDGGPLAYSHRIVNIRLDKNNALHKALETRGVEVVQTCDRETFDRGTTTTHWNNVPKGVREAIEQRLDGFILEAIQSYEGVPTGMNLSKENDGLLVHSSSTIQKRLKANKTLQKALEARGIKFVQTRDRETFDRCVTTCQLNGVPKRVRRCIENRMDSYILNAIQKFKGIPTRRNLSKNYGGPLAYSYRIVNIRLAKNNALQKALEARGIEFVQTCDRETFDRCITTCQWNIVPKGVREAIERRRRESLQLAVNE